MIGRCTNPRASFFERYGGRGISVCERWRTFDNFIADMGRKPGPHYSIDRIDNDGNYEPANCRWATEREQKRNTRRTVMMSVGGRTMCMKDWCRELGLTQGCVRSRLARGMTAEQALSPPGTFAMVRAVGERASKARLTADQVRWARAEYARGKVSGRAIGRLLGISSSAVARMLRGGSWKHISGISPEERERVRAT